MFLPSDVDLITCCDLFVQIAETLQADTLAVMPLSSEGTSSQSQVTFFW